jgi:hypothetical protein
MSLPPQKAEQLAAHRAVLASMSPDEQASLLELLRKLDAMPDVGPEMALDILGSIALYVAKHDVARL